MNPRSPRGPRHSALAELASVEPSASNLLLDTRLVHVEGLTLGSSPRRPHCPIHDATAACAARELLDYRARIAAEFDIAPSRALFLDRHRREVRRLLAPTNETEARTLVMSRLMEDCGELFASPLQKAVALEASVPDEVTIRSTCVRDHRAVDQVVLLVACVFFRAWNEAWAQDTFGALSL